MNIEMVDHEDDGDAAANQLRATIEEALCRAEEQHGIVIDRASVRPLPIIDLKTPDEAVELTVTFNYKLYGVLHNTGQVSL